MLDALFDPPIRLRPRAAYGWLPKEIVSPAQAAEIIPKLPAPNELHWQTANANLHRSDNLALVRRSVANAFDTDGLLDPSDVDAVR